MRSGRWPGPAIASDSVWAFIAITSTVLSCLVAGTLGGCSPREPVPSRPVFVERAAESGLDFVHANGMTGDLSFAEMMGSGGALLDYDGDGDLDVYLVQGGNLDRADPPADPEPMDRLYRHDGDVEALGGSRLVYVDVTARAGLAASGYGMSVATGDLNRDGWLDLYVTNLGANELWLADGRGGFVEMGATAGVDDPRWSTSASLADLDADGWPEIYVVNYTDFRLATHKRCVDDGGVPDYCGPLSYRPEADRLLHNLGDGTFEDRSGRAGLLTAPAAGLGVVVLDIDADGLADVYVANDQMANQLWINQGDGTFRDEALERGCPLDGEGRPQASMGLAVGDVDGDGDDDLLMTHIDGEVNTHYLGDGRGVFEDRTAATGFGVPSLGRTGFGAAMLDYDGDGWLDVMTANGAVKIIHAQRSAGDPLPLKQPNQLLRNLGGRFVEARGEEAVAQGDRVSRGMAAGDIDNDGDIDVVVTNNDARRAPGQRGEFLRLDALRAPHRARHTARWSPHPPHDDRTADDPSRDHAYGRQLPVGVRSARAARRRRGRYRTDRGRMAARRPHQLRQPTARPWLHGPDPAVRGSGGATLEVAARLSALAVTCLLWIGCSASPPMTEPFALPASPPLGALDPGVRQQFAERRTAAERLLTAAEVSPTRVAQAVGSLGMVFHAYGYAAEALTCYGEATRLDDSAFAWVYYLGDVARRLGQLDLAQSALERALELSPDDVPSLIQLAEVRLEAGGDAAALRVLDRGLDLQPRSARARFGRG